MSRSSFARAGAIFLLVFAASPCFAQGPSPRDDLLRLVPRDFGFCLILNDLRGTSARWEKSTWIQAVITSPLGRSVLDAPEFKQLLQFQQDLKKQLGVTWPELRDDVLGDAVVLAYQPAALNDTRSEEGILLLHARDRRSWLDLSITSTRLSDRAAI